MIKKVLFTFILTFIISGCASDFSSHQKAEIVSENNKNEKKYIVTLLPLSDKNSDNGNEILKGITLATNDHNNDHFNKANQKYIIKIFDVNKQKAEAISFINSNPTRAVIGPVFNHDTNEVTNSISKKIPIITFSNDEKLANGNVIVYGIHPKRILAKEISYLQKLSYDNFIVITPNNPISNELIDFLNENFKSSGFSFNKIEYYNNQQSYEYAIKSIAAYLNTNKEKKSALLVIGQNKNIDSLVQTLISERVDLSNIKIFGPNIDWKEYENDDITRQIILKRNINYGINLAEFYFNEYKTQPQNLEYVFYGYEALTLIYNMINNGLKNHETIYPFNESVNIIKFENNVLLREGENITFE